MNPIFLDDIRTPSMVTWLDLPSLPWIIARSFDDFVHLIQTQGLPSFVSFDHDLDEEGPASKTGLDCAKWLVEYCLDHDLALPPFAVHSQNPPGRDNIEGLLSAFARHQRHSRSLKRK